MRVGFYEICSKSRYNSELRSNWTALNQYPSESLWIYWIHSWIVMRHIGMNWNSVKWRPKLNMHRKIREMLWLHRLSSQCAWANTVFFYLCDNENNKIQRTLRKWKPNCWLQLNDESICMTSFSPTTSKQKSNQNPMKMVYFATSFNPKWRILSENKNPSNAHEIFSSVIKKIGTYNKLCCGNCSFIWHWLCSVFHHIHNGCEP